MYLARDKDGLELTFAGPERRPFREMLQAIARHYSIAPSKLPRRIGEIWYSSRGCDSARMTPEERREWLQELQRIRLSRGAILKRCIRDLSVRRSGPCSVRLQPEEVGILMVALNDHRLYLAARNDIGQEEMDLPFFMPPTALTPARRRALRKVHMLGILVESFLHVLDPEAANWMD